MILVKIGGGGEIAIDKILDDLSSLDEPFLIIHGANAFRDEIAERLGVEKEIITSVSGHTSVKSTDDLLDVMLMTYSGVRNKRIVEGLQQRGINAIGLTGVDGGLIRGKKNKGIRARKNGKRMIVRDQSGKPDRINTQLLNLLMSNGYTPVLTVPIIDEENRIINSENDDIVSKICEQMEIESVLMLIEEKGLLRDIKDPTSLIEELDHISLEKWENEVTGRMKRKLYAIRQMINENGPSVIIADGRSSQPVQSALSGTGTVIRW